MAIAVFLIITSFGILTLSMLMKLSTLIHHCKPITFRNLITPNTNKFLKRMALNLTAIFFIIISLKIILNLDYQAIEWTIKSGKKGIVTFALAALTLCVIVNGTVALWIFGRFITGETDEGTDLERVKKLASKDGRFTYATNTLLLLIILLTSSTFFAAKVIKD